MNKPDKGKKGGSCNVTACQAAMSAHYFNKSTRAYYCRKCADEINWPGGRAVVFKLYGTPLLCELDEEKPAMNYDRLAAMIYAQNKAVGWRDDPCRCLFECLQLVSTEVAEATEAERKDLMDDHLPDRKGGEVKLADALIRVLDLGGRLNLHYVSTTRLAPLRTEGSIGLRHLRINHHICAMANALGSASSTPAEVRVAYSRLLDTIEAVADSFGYDLLGAMEEKLRYNQQRADHKRDARAKEGGKKF